jgi:hypothetical protein
MGFLSCIIGFMRTSMKTLLVLLSLVFSATAMAYPQVRKTPFAVAIYPPVEFPEKSFSVNGLRLSVGMGYHRVMNGIDLGLIGNKTEEDFNGMALAGIFNWNKRISTIYLAQLAGLANVNEGESTVYGIQGALIGNFAKYTDVYGVQVSLFNKARAVYGLQLGLINIADNLHGLQIGLANFNAAGPFGVSPLINFGF